GRGVDLLTVHVAGGPAMVRAAVSAAGSACGILAVTVLTSLEASDLSLVWGADRAELGADVVRLARLAADCGAFGVVCGGAELPHVRRVLSEPFGILVPGIRFGGEASNDQRRVITPGEAARLGATHIVLGRTVTRAEDPRTAMARVHEEI